MSSLLIYSFLSYFLYLFICFSFPLSVPYSFKNYNDIIDYFLSERNELLGYTASEGRTAGEMVDGRLSHDRGIGLATQAWCFHRGLDLLSTVSSSGCTIRGVWWGKFTVIEFHISLRIKYDFWGVNAILKAWLTTTITIKKFIDFRKIQYTFIMQPQLYFFWANESSVTTDYTPPCMTYWVCRWKITT